MNKKFIIKNISGTLLSFQIGNKRFKMKSNEILDLVQATGMSIDDIEKTEVINRNKSYNNIEIVEKTKEDNKTFESEKLEKKMDFIIEILKNKSNESKDVINEFSKEKEEKVVLKNEKINEEELKEKFLTIQVDNFKPKKTNDAGFGKKKEEIKVENFEEFLKD